MNEFEFGVCQLEGENYKLELVADQESHFQRPVVTTDENLKAKQVTYLKRVYTRHGDTINFEMHMGVGGGQPYHHLSCTLQKQL